MAVYLLSLFVFPVNLQFKKIIYFFNAKLDVILFYDMPLIVNNLHLYISGQFHQIRSDQ